MPARTWLITGVSSGFDRELPTQLLKAGDRVVGTVRDASKVADLAAAYPRPVPTTRSTTNGLAPGDPARMAEGIIAGVDVEPAPLRMVLGSVALASTLSTLRAWVADLETQSELAASTDFPPGA